MKRKRSKVERSGRKVERSDPKVERSHASLRAKILGVSASEKPAFLPVHEPLFEQCSAAIAQLHSCTEPGQRQLPIPSSMLPPV